MTQVWLPAPAQEALGKEREIWWSPCPGWDRQLLWFACSVLHCDMYSPVMGTCVQVERAACSDVEGLDSRQPEMMSALSFPSAVLDGGSAELGMLQTVSNQLCHVCLTRHSQRSRAVLPGLP